MRKHFKVTLGLFILVAVFLVGIKIFSNNNVSTESKALGKAFKTIEELDNSSQIILKGRIKPSIGQEKQGRFTDELYPIEIIEVIKNTTNNSLEEKDTITLSKSIELEGKESINEGEYILFLNTYEIDGKLFYCNNSINNLYKLEKNKYINVQGDKYKFNKPNAGDLDELDEKNITNVKNKYKNK